jgi:hypothetical protein
VLNRDKIYPIGIILNECCGSGSAITKIGYELVILPAPPAENAFTQELADPGKLMLIQ